jgi:transposase
MKLPDTLPRVEVHHDPLTCTCGQCGGLLETVGEEISEKLDYIPGHFQVIRHIRPKLVCRPCGTIESPALPAQVIDKGLPTARMIAHVMTAKHVDHLPLYRQETQYLRAGVPISRATLCSWLGQGEYWISILAEACKMALLEGTILHADETPLPVLNPGSGKTNKAYLWVYRSQTDAPHPIVVFDYAPDRKGIHAQNFLGRLERHSPDG